MKPAGEPRRAVRIGICGLGTVGSGTVNVMARNREAIAARCGRPVEIVQIGARRDNPACDISGINISREIFDVASNPDVDVLVELIGGTTVARELVLAAVANGKHVVTANKALIAEHGNELFAAAAEQGVTIAYEAAVAGGIPIIKSLREGLVGNRIEWLAGIINGTGNYILTEMREKGRSFDEALRQAQELGYAEADPTFDVEGIDAAHKLVIMASLAFGMPLAFDKVYTEGISGVSSEDIRYADELGYRIKHLGIARGTDKGVELRVHPTLIPQRRLIANVNGVMNAVLVSGDAVGPTLYYGAGAGDEATASAVIADIVDVARTLESRPEERVPLAGVTRDSQGNTDVLPMDEVVTSYYLRISAHDKPGVMSQVASICSDQGISIEALIQHEPAEGEALVPVVILTSRAREARLREAVAQIEALDTVEGAVVRIRVEPLG
ncbi:MULTISPECIES: homoserine dehydrogenase [unclassified Microbulbifer]|uniref:homoserine dehydrogenase n=1 Tax=unclassified Microbulbifer TaxID=2619833 RepID=UPI001E33C947|nr:homoserine dehydrogenase [Microbulbifer sp. YPW16]UHQ57142.1 homoserine dehydrogenase [Microbulbifer sp. YPW16]